MAISLDGYKRSNAYIYTKIILFSNCKRKNKTSSEAFKILDLTQISKVMTLLAVPAEDKSQNH